MKKKILTFAAVAAMVLASGAYADEVEFPEGECFTDSVLADGKTHNPDYKSIEFKTVDGIRTACMDDKSWARTQSINIPNDVSVKQVIYNRTFTGNANSTIFFPFGGKVYGDIFGGVFNKFSKIFRYCGEWCQKTDPWYLDVTGVDSLEPNVPYIFGPRSESLPEDGTMLIIAGKSSTNDSLIFNSTTGTGISKSTDPDDTNFYLWEFRGTYDYKTWTAESSDLGRVYGLATKDIQKNNGTDSIKAGQFVKGTSGVSIAPMRAYLYYNRVSALTKTAADSSAEILSDEDLPETIIVRYLDAEGNVTAIGEMNTRTGNVTMDKDVWFDMKGRKFNKKPTVKGTYYNQGNKVIIK